MNIEAKYTYKTIEPKKKSKAGCIIIALIILGGLIGTYVVYETKINNVNTTFDNKANNQNVLLGTNTESVTANELPSLLENTTKPLEKGSFADETILFPIKVSEGEKIGVQTYFGQGVWNPIAEKSDLLPVGRILTIPKSGTEIIVPQEGVEMFQMFEIVDGESYFRGIALQYFGQDGTRFVLRIVEPGNFGQSIQLTIASTIDAPKVEPIDIKKYNLVAQKGKGLAVDAGKAIAKTISNNARVEFDLDIYSSSYSAHPTSYNFSFLTNDQNNKISCVTASSNH